MKKKIGYRHNAAVAMLSDIERNDLASREAFGQPRGAAIKEIIRNRSDPGSPGVREDAEDGNAELRAVEARDAAAREMYGAKEGSVDGDVDARYVHKPETDWPGGYVGPFHVKSRGIFDSLGRCLATVGDARTSAEASVACAKRVAEILNS